MEKINIPEGLPNCKIINTLVSKANSKTDYEFNYVQELENIRNRISIEVSRINLLFPEYTPHDDKYHLKRLFYVADQMLGDEVVESMNVTELFLISVSLYAHDWGMAISEDEKDYILSDCKDSLSPNINILTDENSRIKEFCRNRNIELKDIQLAEWQEYVRLTHALRSGKRIKDYFDSISTGVAEFASRICEGHWLDFDIIDDYSSYPTDAAIHRDIVNVKALTIYVRLIDLLDLGEDRTPYVLWKFVAPRNKFSKLEWAKHRALQPVTFPQYQSNRYIQVEGSTDDQNVYMSVMDLKRYVDDQFRQCLDILNRINHCYHKLDISHIDWRIAARGFEPVKIQFEFDRNRMFDILGDEIYQNNPYVFIRELLQNAIDAIEMRTEILDKIDLSFKPKIKLEVKEEDEFYIVQITDNGIGMDEYIIRNYLAVAGKSYYRSVDFQKEGLKMDPISRFGIGVLSCFMVSDYIEIDTYKDPNTSKKQEHLKISIPAKENYFKIKKNTETLEIGTTFKVFVVKNKLPKNKDTGEQISFNITEYLKRIAGFVKYPISIIENNSELLINSPNVNLLNTSSAFIIDYKFPIDKAILPQNIETVKEYFTEKRYHLKTDLELINYDGCITYLLPKDDNIDIYNCGRSWPTREIKIVDYKNELLETKKIKWKDEWGSFRSYSSNKNRTSIPEKSYSVFMDGILLQDITPPDIDINKAKDLNFDLFYNSSITDSFVNPQLIVNIPKPIGMKIDLARTNIETTEKWDNPIWNAFFAYLKKTLIKEIVSKEPKDRLLSLAKLMTFHKLSDTIINDRLVEFSEFPLPFLSKNLLLNFHELNDSNLEYIKLFPSKLSIECFELLKSEYLNLNKYEGILNNWIGSETLLNSDGFRYSEKTPASLSNMSTLIKAFIMKNYYLSSINFITSPLGNRFPLVEEVLKIKPKDILPVINQKDIHKLNLEKIDEYNTTIFNALLKQKFYTFPTLIKFPLPYESKAFYSFNYLNLNNKMIKDLADICLSLIIAKENKTLSSEIIGKLFDMVNELSFVRHDYSDNDIIQLTDFNAKLNDLFLEAAKHGLFENLLGNKVEITFDDFVENSILIDKKTKSFNSNYDFKKYLNGRSDWGELII